MSDLQDTVDWSKKWLVDLNACKTQLVSMDHSNNSGVNEVKIEWSVLEEQSSFIKMLGFLFLLYWTGTLTLFFSPEF